jgi:hypothetical protein
MNANLTQELLQNQSSNLKKKDEKTKWPHICQDYIQRLGYPNGLIQIAKDYDLSKSDKDAIRNYKNKVVASFDQRSIKPAGKDALHDSDDDLFSM